MKNFKKGFTLIELLVVIAIIGILSSVVLASLNTARSKGSDAAIKGNLSGMRAQAELIYDGASCYNTGTNTTCPAAAVSSAACPTVSSAAADTLFKSTNIGASIAAAKSAGSALMACSTAASQAAWAVVAQLKSDPLKGFCVDSTGKSKEVTIASNDQAGLTAEVSAGACVE